MSSFRVLGITGYKRCGKSTFADTVQKLYPNTSRYSFAKPLKEVCHILFGGTDAHWYGDMKESALPQWADVKLPFNNTPRCILQYVGTEIFRDHVNANFWVEVAKVYINDMFRAEGFNLLIVDDVRFDNEAKALIETFDATIVKLTRLDGTSTSDGHASERGIADRLVDYRYNVGPYTEIPLFAADCLRRMGIEHAKV